MFKLLLLITTLLMSQGLYAKNCSPLLDHTVKTLNDKKTVNLCEMYQGKVVLVVNTASRCAYTDQYDSLEKLYSQYKDKGLVVLGFPSNDFGAQEPGTEKQIQSFCRLTYGVEFPMFSKTRVARPYSDPVFVALGNAAGTYPSWNFHKYLIGRDGQLINNFNSAVDPLSKTVINEIKKAL